MEPQGSRRVVFSLFLVLLLCSFPVSARPLAPKQGEKEVKVGGISYSARSYTDSEDLSNLMGLEKCDDKDDGCLERRMMADAHLDYIYTQHHKP